MILTKTQLAERPKFSFSHPRKEIIRTPSRASHSSSHLSQSLLRLASQDSATHRPHRSRGRSLFTAFLLPDYLIDLFDRLSNLQNCFGQGDQPPLSTQTTVRLFVVLSSSCLPACLTVKASRFNISLTD
eukprot:Selendium_serpulae@DN5803_c2_g1_i14.p1